MVQVHVLARVWGFESLLRHQSFKINHLEILLLFVTTSGFPLETAGNDGKPMEVIYSKPLSFRLSRKGARVWQIDRLPAAAQPYAILLLRGCIGTLIRGTISSRRRRSTLQLLVDFGISADDWQEIRQYLHDEDLDCVVAAARLGLCVARDVNRESIVEALIEASSKMNWAQEMEVIEILDQYRFAAQSVARTFASRRRLEREKPNWVSPFWRILRHVLGSELHCER
jgi:hypothetical protein